MAKRYARASSREVPDELERSIQLRRQRDNRHGASGAIDLGKDLAAVWRGRQLQEFLRLRASIVPADEVALQMRTQDAGAPGGRPLARVVNAGQHVAQRGGRACDGGGTECRDA